MAGDVEFEFRESQQMAVIAGLEAGGLVTYMAEHAHHVEFDSYWGGSPPPFPKLRKWVGRKWPDLSAGLKDAGLSSGVREGSERHKDGVTWVVVNSIQESGIEGVFFGRRSLEEGRNKADGIAGAYEGTNDPRASHKIVEDVVDLMFARSQEIIADEASDTGNLLQSGQVEITEDIGELPEA